jgi:predicted transglutaminase-like cysteine proteinase
MWVARMRRSAMAGLLALTGLTPTISGPAQAEGVSMKVNGWSNPPVGYVQFCRSFADQCRQHGREAAASLTAERWRDLQEVNLFVNRSVRPVTDLAYYNSEEVWALPSSYGDCEDYVLMKRKLLVERGWSTGALLVTVVFDEVGDGHAVLLVRTDRGELVLDNKTDAIFAWYETAYRFVKRQSVADPNRWVSVGDPRWTARSTAAPR